MPSSAQSAASASGVGHVGPGPGAVGGAASQDAPFGRAVAVEGDGVGLDADGAAGIGIDGAARQRVDDGCTSSRRRLPVAVAGGRDA